MSTTDCNFYFVSVVDGRRKALLAGPYLTHDEALLQVAKVSRLAEEADPRSAWYAFGTAGSDLPHKTTFGVVT